MEVKEIDSSTMSKVINPKRNVKIFGQDNRVLSASRGIVVKIYKEEHSQVILIKSDKYVFIYENLGESAVVENQKVLRGDFLGTALNNSVVLTITKNTIEIKKPDELLECECLK